MDPMWGGRIWPGGVLALSFALLSGCASSPRCEGYPDRGTPICAYETFVRAWRDGDLEVIEQTFAPSRLEVHRQDEKNLGREGLREWYQRDAGRIELGEPESEGLGPKFASVRVPAMIDRPGGGETTMVFDFVFKDLEWKLFRIRGLPPGR